MDSLFYALVYNWLNRRISQFGIDAASHATGQVTNFALMLVTLWVFFRGYRMVTGQSQDSMMSTVTQMIKISLIVVAAKTVSVAGSDFYQFLNTTIPEEVNYIVTGSTDSPKEQIDKNLLLISAATSAINMVQVPTGDPALAEEKARTSMLASLGIAGPAMTAGAMLLLYQIAMAMLVGLAPLFIMCLIFDQTKDLFKRWLMYLVGTVFSMAMLNLVTSWTLDLTARVAGALWTTDALTRMTGLTAQGFNTQAFQQGGVGLLMTVLIFSTPPMAAMLFNGTLGNFMAYSQLAGASTPARQGPNGQAPGSYNANAGYTGGGYFGQAPQMSSGAQGSGSRGDVGAFNNPATAPRGMANAPVNRDTLKPYEGA